MQRSTFFIGLGVLILLIVLYKLFAQPVEIVLLGIDISNKTTTEEIDFLLSTLEQYDATATFFVPGIYAERNPELVAKIAENHEIACRSMWLKRASQMNESSIREDLVACKQVLEEVSGQTVVGYRAPNNIIDERTYALLPEVGYEYDATIFENLGWFYPQPSIEELPVSALGLLPLSDRWLAKRFFLGDLGYFLIKRDREVRVSVALDPGVVYSHRGALQYLLYEYTEDEVQFATHASQVSS